MAPLIKSMTRKIKISYFSNAFKFIVGPLLLGAAIYLAFDEYFAWVAIFLLVVVMIFTTNYVTEINLEQKIYRDYLYFLGLDLNEEARTFDKLEKIVITKGTYSQNINTRSRSTRLDWSDYTGTLLHDGNESLNLLTRNDKEELLKGLKEFAQYLSVDVEDRTVGEPYLVDMKAL